MICRARCGGDVRAPARRCCRPRHHAAACTAPVSWNSGCSAASSAWGALRARRGGSRCRRARGRQRALQLGRLDATQAAAGAPGERAATFAHGGEALADQRHAPRAGRAPPRRCRGVRALAAMPPLSVKPRAESSDPAAWRASPHGRSRYRRGDRRLMTASLAEDRGVNYPGVRRRSFAVRPACGARVVEHGDLPVGTEPQEVLPGFALMIQKISKSNYNVS